MWWARLLNVISGLLAGGVAASTTSYESIQTYTVGAGGQASITFSSIPSTFKHLQVRGISRDTSATYASNDMVMQLNSDTAGNYSWHRLYGTGSAAAADSAANASYMDIGQESTAAASANFFGTSVVDILDYADANKYKTVRCLTGIDLNGGADGRVMLTSGNWRSTSAVSTVLVKPVSGNFAQYSSFALYGIKG
jgi:hypothetical protein